MLVLLFVALWFILRGYLLYVFFSVCHFVLVFFSPFSIAMTSLGEEGANLSAFHTFVRFVLVFRFVGFLFLLGSGKGCGLWLWHSLDFSLTFFLIRSSNFICTRGFGFCHNLKMCMEFGYNPQNNSYRFCHVLNLIIFFTFPNFWFYLVFFFEHRYYQTVYIIGIYEGWALSKKAKKKKKKKKKKKCSSFTVTLFYMQLINFS